MARAGEDEDEDAEERGAEPAQARAATGSGRGPALRAGALRLLGTRPWGRGGGGAGRRITPGRRVASGPAPRPLATWKPPGLRCLSGRSARLELTARTDCSNRVPWPLLQILSVAQEFRSFPRKKGFKVTGLVRGGSVAKDHPQTQKSPSRARERICTARNDTTEKLLGSCRLVSGYQSLQTTVDSERFPGLPRGLQAREHLLLRPGGAERNEASQSGGNRKPCQRSRTGSISLNPRQHLRVNTVSGGRS